MSDTASGWDIAGIVGGIGTLASLIGAGIWRLISRADTRTASIEAKEAALVTKLELRVAALEEDNRRIWLALSYVVPALHAHDPGSPALRMAAKLLGDAFPIDLSAAPVKTEEQP